MTHMGWLHFGSMVYLSGVISLALSLNESRDPRRALSETLRRWRKFLALTLVIALVVYLMSR